MERRLLAKGFAYSALGATAAALLLCLPTALIPNPLFTRIIPPRLVDYLIFGATVALTALFAATFAWPARCPLPERRLTVGGLLSFFAVGCPTCNKIVLLFPGTSGAVQWFQPLQPLFGLVGIILLAWAPVARLRLLGVTSPISLVGISKTKLYLSRAVTQSHADHK